MRIFLCSYDNFFLAIPMNIVSSIFLTPKKNTGIIDYDSENNNTYISLPMFFNDKEYKVCHGIILKNGSQNHDTDSNLTEGRTILLSSKILSEKEIPSEHFNPVPKTLSAYRDFSIIKGIFFISHNTADKETAEGIVLLLNIEQLEKTIKKELKHD